MGGLHAPTAVRWELRDAPSKPVKAGGRFALRLVAHIEEGWHLYAMNLAPGGPIPTRIWLAEGQPFQLAAPVKAPDPITFQDPNFNMEVGFFAGKASFELPIRATAGTDGPQKVTVSASYQVCSDRICLPPRTVKMEAPVRVKK